MRVLINHLTRMKRPYVCVAGVGTDGSHVRPVLESGQLGRDLLRSEGGPFTLGAVVDLGNTRHRPGHPEEEDLVFRPELIKTEKMLTPAEFAKVMDRFAKSSLGEIFGDDLVQLGRTAAVPKGAGIASLGVFRVEGTKLSPEELEDGRIRLIVADPDLGEMSLPVTDIRLWEPDHKTPVWSRIEAIRPVLEKRCLLAVGLSRAFPPDSPDSRHWLQVNNIFPIDDPLWARE